MKSEEKTNNLRVTRSSESSDRSHRNSTHITKVEKTSPFVFQETYQVTKNVAQLGDIIFDSNEKKQKQQQQQNAKEDNSFSKAFDSWVNKPSSNPASGFARGLLSFGSQTVKGVTGIVSEPIKGAMEDGGKGFAIGVVKGLTGVVARPIAGLIELGAKTTEGLVATPISIAEGLKGRSENNDVPKEPIFFGRPLEESFKYALENEKIHLTELAIEYLLEYGIHIEGIFRLSGSSITLAAWKQKFDNGEEMIFDESVWPHDVCALLKLYFRELPDGLIPASKWLPLFESTDDNTFNIKLDEMIMSLDTFNKLVLFKLFHLLDIIIAHEEVTKMNISNLAVCLSPCLLRFPDTPSSEMRDLEFVQKSSKVFVKLLSSWKTLSDDIQRHNFASPPPNLPPPTLPPPPLLMNSNQNPIITNSNNQNPLLTNSNNQIPLTTNSNDQVPLTATNSRPQLRRRNSLSHIHVEIQNTDTGPIVLGINVTESM